MGQIVSKEIAVWLRGLDYDEPTRRGYLGDKVLYAEEWDWNTGGDHLYSAPQINDALNWIADVKNIPFDFVNLSTDEWRTSIYKYGYIFEAEVIGTRKEAEAELLKLIYDNKEALGL